MKLADRNVGVAFTGSFCTNAKVLEAVKQIVAEGAHVKPIFSFNSQTINSRFGQAKEYMEKISEITSSAPILTIEDAEPLGPKNMLDILIIAPCTGNTLAKFCHGIIDTPVLMAAKGHLRNGKPLVLSISTNDALGINSRNIGDLLNMKNIYFVPFGQDDYIKKPNSMVAHVDLIIPTLEEALENRQIQPIVRSPF
ncbi:MAG TPA: dipicolinate synthase subunit B [Lachnospiraceae bacterium]|nr:dipicolinate synthase subunit B [Lachnospiraceae bacterium]HEX3076594.1 dipicolinate synthase subunit B [Lachnospiraceae bacterium]